MSFHISRWRYWWAYLAIILLALYTIWLTDRAADVASWIIGIITVLLLVIMEVVIRRERIDIADGVEVIRGKSIVHVPFNRISQVSTSQSFLQNIFRYGTIELKTPGETIYVSGIAEANKLARQIEGKMHSVHKTHKHELDRKPKSF